MLLVTLQNTQYLQLYKLSLPLQWTIQNLCGGKESILDVPLNVQVSIGAVSETQSAADQEDVCAISLLGKDVNSSILL